MSKEIDENEYRRLLHLGLGRAILYAKEHDVRHFRDVILDACLHCYAYDPQCEGTRADYMLELVGLMPDKEFFYGEVLKALPRSGDDWDAAQRFRFAACLAFDGNDLAKRAMYESFEPGPKMGEGIGINFVQMDGIEGLLFAAERIGALLVVKPDAVDVGWLLSHSIDEFGEQAVQDALKEAGEENPRIEAFRLEAEARKGRCKSPEILGASYEQLKLKLGETGLFWIAKWGEEASEEDFVQAAHGLVAARDTKDQFAHLNIFRRRRFPLDIQILLRLADVEQDGVGIAATMALSLVTHPAVRELAFRLVDNQAPGRGDAIELLAANFQPGDHAVALHWFKSEEDLEVKHSMGMDLENFWKRHPQEHGEVPMLRDLYELGPCSFCREGTVRRLIELSGLTEEMRSECAYDANAEIRKLVEQSPATKS
jgi:hypothetical protein